MKGISEIDKNLAVESTIAREGLRFYNAESTPFRIYGVYREGEKFRRLPESIAATVSESVHALHANTAGGRVRFVTDSPYVAIKTAIVPGKMPHFALTGSCGYDMYEEKDGKVNCVGTFIPPFDVEEEYENVLDFKESGKRIVTINFPLYSEVKWLLIGLQEGTVLEEAPDYRVEKPVVFYGSSITQGGCASRPGCSYESMISRRLNCNYTNLGFSGSAKAEDEIAEYIKRLDMSVFVLDYDHNANDSEHLRKTHGKMFRAIREAQPDVPIVMLSMPKYTLIPVEVERRDIIRQTYLDAKESGDQNVYFIAGQDLLALAGDDWAVDGTHPTDLGFFSMASVIGDLLEKILV